MRGYTKHIEVYQYTETVIRYDGTEVARETNNDEHWYDTQSAEAISDEEAEDWL